MSLDSIFEAISSQAAKAKPLDATLKFDFGDGQIHIDGTGDSNVVTKEDKEAKCVISTTMDVFDQLRSGKLNPMMAVMSGKVKIKGDMGLAMKLPSLLG